MPLYDVKCDSCGRSMEVYLSLSDYNDLPECCGVPMKRMICAPNVISDDIAPYRSQVTGEMIASKSQHKNHLKQHGLVELGNDKPKPKVKSEAEKRAEKHSLRKSIADAMSRRGM